MTLEQQEELRNELSTLRSKRDDLIAELGVYAQENNDLRENSAYINVERKIQLVDAQIARVLWEFQKLELAKKKVAHLQKLKKSVKTHKA